MLFEKYNIIKRDCNIMKYVLLLILLAGCAQTLQFTQWDEGLPKTGEWRTNLAVGDVNNDGLLDIAGIGRKGTAYASVWLNQGNGSWKPSVDGILQEMECGVGADFGDVNNDGNLDIAYGRHCGGPIVYLGDGTGKWTNYSTGLLAENVNPIALADFDNDGLADIITLGAVLEGFTIYKNTGDGWNITNTNLPDKMEASTYQIIIDDINTDGKQDIIAGAGVYVNKGNLTFEQNFAFTASYIAYKDNFLVISGARQLLVYKQENDWQLYRNLTMSCEKGGGVDLEDMNNDGKTDLTASCTTGIRTFKGPNFEETNNNIPLSEKRPQGLHIADVNNDGKNDIIAAYGQEGGNGGIHIWVRT